MNNFYLETEDNIFRPVTLEDAEFIVKLRNLPHAKKMVHGTSTSIEQQRDWIKKYLERENDYYWIIEDRDGKPIGTTSLYNYKADINEIESGRWIQIPDTNGVTSLSAHVLFRDFAYNVLKVSRIICDTAVINKQVIRYHQFLGEKVFKRVLDDEVIDGKRMELIWFEETSESWSENKRRLLKFCGDESDRRVFRIEADGSLTRLVLSH